MSDRALVFLLASLKVWNNETMKDFLDRAYKIVTGTADDNDLKKTNIHACLSHVLLVSVRFYMLDLTACCFLSKDTRKTVNKYIPENFRDLAMWSISLLINTSTWDEFLHDWQLICTVFVQLHLGKEHVNKESYDNLLNRITKIQSDPNLKKVIRSTESLQIDNGNNLSSSLVYEYRDDDDDDGSDVNPRLRLPRSESRSAKRKVSLLEDGKRKSKSIRMYNTVRFETFYFELNFDSLSYSLAAHCAKLR